MGRTGAEAAEPELEALEDGLAEKDEDPGVQDRVEGVETEGQEVPHLTAVRSDGLGEAADLRTQRGHQEVPMSPHPTPQPTPFNPFACCRNKGGEGNKIR